MTNSKKKKKKKKRFSQPGYRAIRNIVQLILNATNILEYQNELEDVLSDYSEEINQYRLSTQLQILKTKFVDSNEKTGSPVINYMKNNIGVQADFYSEIIVLLKLYLGSPAMNVASERSPSAMRHIKNWLRSEMSQEGLNHCMPLSIHKEKADEINLKNVANVLCEANEERRRTFGIFCDEDFLQLKT